MANGVSLETARRLRMGRLISRADEVFDAREAAVDWLKSPNAALRGNAPLSLLDTDIDAETVLDTLGRIEHGVFP
ncbi:MAG: antitoxin Xre/MbcA/ParS toxin-binding domain-containing protein [Steroidobacterales bacterium]